MFELNEHPLSLTFTCPDCNCKLGKSTSLHFFGTYTMAECFCECCENIYLHSLPNGITSIYPISFSLKTGKAKYDSTIHYLAEPQIRAIKDKQATSSEISKTIYKETKEILFLNCLDTSYDRVLLKLIQANFFSVQYPTRGLVVLLPVSFEWLLPKSTAEVWLVNVSLDKLDKKIDLLDDFIKNELIRFRSVLFCDTLPYCQVNRNELAQYFKFPPFDLRLLINRPLQITFVLSEEDVLLRSTFDLIMFRYAKAYFIKKQKNFIERLVNEIQLKSASPIKFAITGYGSRGKFKDKIKDLRAMNVDRLKEKEWSLLYAESHLVIGVGGSSMLIPKLLAAGSIELLLPNTVNLIEAETAREEGSCDAFFNKKINSFSSIDFIAKEVLKLLTEFTSIRQK